MSLYITIQLRINQNIFIFIFEQILAEKFIFKDIFRNDFTNFGAPVRGGFKAVA